MKIGVLGAARIAPAAVVKPARVVDDVEIAAVAARDRDRAAAFAARHGVPTVHGSYADLVADPSLDAVYIPLPNGLHAQWTLAAVEAGKHVLCEKPFTANAAQARDVATAAATRPDLVVMEAFHYRYHPLATRMLAVVHSGELGRVRHVETALCFPLPAFSNIRYNYGLAGGALMDAGCYAVHCLRLLSPGTPTVTTAKAVPLRRDRRIDRAMTADFDLGDDATGRVTASMWSRTLLRIQARVIGDNGTLTVNNFVGPHAWTRFTVTTAGARRREHFSREPTYVHQLRAFHAAVQGEPTNLTPPSDSIATMSLIDDIYTAAGLPLRGEPRTP
jgi:predicted dehydrogenase